MPSAVKANCVELTVVEGRCVYLNNHRIAGNKPYVSENLRHSFYQVPVAVVLNALGSTIEQSSIVAATVKPDLMVEPVSKPYKLDWTDQWDNCDLCECCGNLVSGGQLFNRLSLAVTMLYTHGALTPTQRDAARSKLKKLAA